MKLSTITQQKSPKQEILRINQFNEFQNNPGQPQITPNKLKLALQHKQQLQNSNDSPQAQQKQHSFRPRSNTVKNDQGSVINLKKVKTSSNKQDITNSKTLSTKKFASNQSFKSSIISSPKTTQFKTLAQENKQLKDNILMLTKLIQEVVPAITQLQQQQQNMQNNFDHSAYNQTSQTNFSKFSPTNQSTSQLSNIFGTMKSKSRTTAQDQLTQLQKSLQQLQLAYVQKQTDEEGGCFTDQDSEYMDAEDLDLGSIDERTANPINTTNNRHQDLRQSFLTFGGNKTEGDCSQLLSLRKNQIDPPLTGQRINSNSTQKTKISDLNKQSKNFNMPVCLDSIRSRKKIIDYEGVKQLQGMIDNINKSEILQELKLIQPYTSNIKSKLQDNSRNNNQILESNYSSANISGDSSISDDEGSIPADSLLCKNLLEGHQTIYKQNLLQELKSQPFNKFSLGNLQNQQNNSNTLKNQLYLHSKLDQQMYPKIIPLTTQNFNSCTSIESYEDVQNVKLIDYISQEQQNAKQQLQEQFINLGTDINNQIIDSNPNQIITTKDAYELHENCQVQLFDQQNQSSQISQINIEIGIKEIQDNCLIIQQQKSQSNIDQQLNSSQLVKEENFEYKEMRNDNDESNYQNLINEFNALKQINTTSQIDKDEYLLQTQSKDCFMFNQSVEMTDQNLQNSKRGSVDPQLQHLMKNESPLKAQIFNDSIQNSERRDIGNAIGFEDSQKLDLCDLQILQSRKESSINRKSQKSKKSIKSSNKKNKENVDDHEKTKLINYSPENDQTTQKQSVQVYQIQKNKNTKYGSALSPSKCQTIKVIQSLSNNKESIMSSYDNSPQSSTKQYLAMSDTFQRGKSISHHLQNTDYYKTQNVNLKIIKSQRAPFELIQNKWNTQEEKEKNLAKMNQELLHNQIQKKFSIDNQETDRNIMDISPQSNIRQTPQIAKHNGNVTQDDTPNDNLEFSSFNMTLTNQAQVYKQHSKQQSLDIKIIANTTKNTHLERQLVIENFALQPIIITQQQHSLQNESTNSYQQVQESMLIPENNEKKSSFTKVQLQQQQEMSFNQTFNAFQQIKDDPILECQSQNLQITNNIEKIDIIPQITTNGINIQRSSRDKFIKNYKTHQKEQLINELDRLSTPSPRKISEVLIDSPTSQQTIPQVNQTIEQQIQQQQYVETSINNIQMHNSYLNDERNNHYDNGIYDNQTQDDSNTYKSTQLDNLMNDYLKDYNHRNNRNSLSNDCQSQRQSASPNQQMRSQYSSAEFIEVSAPDLNDYSTRKTLLNQYTTKTSAQTGQVYDYQSSKLITNDTNTMQQDSSLDMQIAQDHLTLFTGGIKVYDSKRTSCQSSVQNQVISDNSTIKEEPSFEEQDSSTLNKYSHNNQSVLQSQKLNLVQQQLTESQISDHDSKISLTNIDMVDSEIFSNFHSNKSLKDKLVLPSNFTSNQTIKNDCQQPHSQKHTPIKASINIASSSASKNTSPIIEEKCRSTRQLPIDIIRSQKQFESQLSQQQSASFLQPILQQQRDKLSLSRSPLKSVKQRDSLSIDNSRILLDSENQHHSLTAQKVQAVREKREQMYKQKMDELQQKLDIKLQKITSLPQTSRGDNIEGLENDQILITDRENSKERSPSTTRTIQNKYKIQTPQKSLFNSVIKLRTNAQSTTNLKTIKQTNNTCVIMRKNQRDSSRQKELETKFQEKEERIKCILQKKKEIDDKIKEQKLVRELRDLRQSQDSIVVGQQQNDQHQNQSQKQLSLTRGSLVLVRTPSKQLQQKMVLKKDMTTIKLKQNQIYNSNQKSNKSNVLTQITQNQNQNTTMCNQQNWQQHSYLKLQQIQSQKHLNLENIQQHQLDSFHKDNINNNNNASLLGAITERINTMQNKEPVLSPILMRIQPTLKQKEFFQKIESDCQQRKQIKHTSRIEQQINNHGQNHKNNTQTKQVKQNQ